MQSQSVTEPMNEMPLPSNDEERVPDSLPISSFAAGVRTLSDNLKVYARQLRLEGNVKEAITVIFVAVAWTSIQVCVGEFFANGFNIVWNGRDDETDEHDLNDALAVHVLEQPKQQLSSDNLTRRHSDNADKSQSDGKNADPATNDSAKAQEKTGDDQISAIASSCRSIDVQNVTKRLIKLCEQALKESGRPVEAVDRVEVIGLDDYVSSTQKTLENFFQKAIHYNLELPDVPIHQSTSTFNSQPPTTSTRPSAASSSIFLPVRQSVCCQRSDLQPDPTPTLMKEEFAVDGANVFIEASKTAPKDTKVVTVKTDTCYFEDLDVYVTVLPSTEEANFEECNEDSLFKVKNGRFVHSDGSTPFGSATFSQNQDDASEQSLKGFSFNEESPIYQQLKNKEKGSVKWIKYVSANPLKKEDKEKAKSLELKQKKELAEMQKKEQTAKDRQEEDYRQSMGSRHHYSVAPTPKEEEPKEKEADKISPTEKMPEPAPAPEMEYYDDVDERNRTALSVIYTATDIRTNESVIMKRAMQTADLPKKMHHEIEILKQAQGPGIVQFREAFVDYGLPHIVMERMETNCGNIFYFNEEFTEAERKAYIKMALIAMKTIHDCDIIHADIKPDNFLYKHGVGLKLCDFGNSRRLDEEYESGLIHYKRTYRAPELYRDKPKVSKASDMWAIGVLHQDFVMGRAHWTRARVDTEMKQLLRLKCNAEQLHTVKEFSQLGDDEFDFMKRLAIWRPEKRMTIDEALDHPWMTGGCPPTPVELLHRVKSLKEESRRKRKANEALGLDLEYEREAKHRNPFF